MCISAVIYGCGWLSPYAAVRDLQFSGFFLIFLFKNILDGTGWI